MAQLTIYVAGSFNTSTGCACWGASCGPWAAACLDWTNKAVPPPRHTPAERRIWMDTDRDGGEVYAFCHNACLTADMVIFIMSSIPKSSHY